MDTTNKLAEAERRLSDFLSQFEYDVQERLLRYALDHIVPRLKGAKSDATQAVSEPVATQPAEAVANWTPLPEDPQERAMFDGIVKRMGQGDVRLAIALALRTGSVAMPGGSLAEQFRIYANEIVKLRLPAAASAPEHTQAAVGEDLAIYQRIAENYHKDAARPAPASASEPVCDHPCGNIACAVHCKRASASVAGAGEALTDEQKKALTMMIDFYGNDPRVQCLKPLLAARPVADGEAADEAEALEHAQWRDMQIEHERDLDHLHDVIAQHSHDAQHWWKACNETRDCLRHLLEECKDACDVGDGRLNTSRIEEIIARDVGELPDKADSDNPENYVDGPSAALARQAPAPLSQAVPEGWTIIGPDGWRMTADKPTALMVAANQHHRELNPVDAARQAKNLQAAIADELAEHERDRAELVSRFLGWPLPKTFAPDCGISFTPIRHAADAPAPFAGQLVGSWPVGTNLFTADEARAMLDFVLDCDAGDRELSRHPQPQAVTEDARDGERINDLEAARHFHRLVAWSDDLQCWLTPGNFEHSTFREALDEVLEGYRKSRDTIADAARAATSGSEGEGR